jgi:hypothetical protein
MKSAARGFLPLLVVICGTTLSLAATAIAQELRYEPSRPTVSPYLNLFRNDFDNRGLPNYYLYVRPLQRQAQVNQQQQAIIQQQQQMINQLQGGIEDIERRAAEGQLVAPTGHASWFQQPGTRSTFLNTSRYYSRSGTATPR